jgi:hypothetical protein
MSLIHRRKEINYCSEVFPRMGARGRKKAEGKRKKEKVKFEGRRKLCIFLII